MTMLAKMLTAAALAGVAAAPAAAQYQYPQPYPQPYPSYPQQGYPQQGYPQQGYPQGGNVFEQMIGGLLGGNYNVDERQAVTQCAQAAMAQAQNQYRGGYSGYQQPYQYGQQGFAPPGMRVTAITQVERRSSGLRVRGLIDSGYYGGQWGYQQQYQQGYQNQQYAVGDLKFRCTVDYRGYVSNVRVERNDDYRRY